MVRILVVEDEPLIAELVAEALGDEGMAVTVAHSGGEAIRRLDEEPRAFAAVVTDIDLGNHIDGFAVAREARAQDPKVKVVYVTGKPSNLYAAEDEALMFPKPFNVADLANQVRLVVGV